MGRGKSREGGGSLRSRLRLPRCPNLRSRLRQLLRPRALRRPRLPRRRRVLRRRPQQPPRHFLHHRKLTTNGSNVLRRPPRQLLRRPPHTALPRAPRGRRRERQAGGEQIRLQRHRRRSTRRPLAGRRRGRRCRRRSLESATHAGTSAPAGARGGVCSSTFQRFCRRDKACPVSTGGGTRRVRLVREEGQGVSG